MASPVTKARNDYHNHWQNKAVRHPREFKTHSRGSQIEDIEAFYAIDRLRLEGGSMYDDWYMKDHNYWNRNMPGKTCRNGPKPDVKEYLQSFRPLHDSVGAQLDKYMRSRYPATEEERISTPRKQTLSMPPSKSMHASKAELCNAPSPIPSARYAITNQRVLRPKPKEIGTMRTGKCR